tara:strand:- start:1174 stop:1341 length:168 start_codon:yes stop_codon:yes gene_type:complete
MVKRIINKYKQITGIEYTGFAIYGIAMTLLFLYGVVNIIIALFAGNAAYVPYDLF